MGMFDYVTFEGKQYQTKDTPQQTLDDYEIRGDELWWRKCEYEWEENGSRFGGYMKETSHEWLFCVDFDGLILFYREDKENGGHKADKWVEYKALFMNGKIIKLERIE
jgi:hypothetical protein